MVLRQWKTAEDQQAINSDDVKPQEIEESSSEEKLCLNTQHTPELDSNFVIFDNKAKGPVCCFEPAFYTSVSSRWTTVSQVIRHGFIQPMR